MIAFAEDMHSRELQELLATLSDHSSDWIYRLVKDAEARSKILTTRYHWNAADGTPLPEGAGHLAEEGDELWAFAVPFEHRRLTGQAGGYVLRRTGSVLAFCVVPAE